MITLTAFRLTTIASIGLLLGACSTVRLEDVPSSKAIDTAALNSQANLLIPPGMGEVPAAEPAVAEPVHSGDLATPETPLPQGAIWRVRYRDNGFDAENKSGDTCSGWLAYGEAGPRPGQLVKMACSDGRLAKLVVGAGEGETRAGTVVFGNESETAFIQGN